MLRFLVLTTLMASAFGYGYGRGGYSSGYSSGGYGGAIPLAINSRRSILYRDVPSTYSNPEPLTVAIPPSTAPLNFIMQSRSSPINVQTSHQPSPGSYRETSSIDEPHVRVHTVQRPIVQEVREIISPYRRLRQQVQPVQEEVNTLIARGSSGYSSGGSSGYSSGGSYGGSSRYSNGY